MWSSSTSLKLLDLLHLQVKFVLYIMSSINFNIWRNFSSYLASGIAPSPIYLKLLIFRAIHSRHLDYHNNLWKLYLPLFLFCRDAYFGSNPQVGELSFSCAEILQLWPLMNHRWTCGTILVPENYISYSIILLFSRSSFYLPSS